jgi:hypothetical protein
MLLLAVLDLLFSLRLVGDLIGLALWPVLVLLRRDE